MPSATLRKVGGSIMLAIPPSLLETLKLSPGTKVGISIESRQLVITPPPHPRYTLKQLLAQCNPKASRNRQDRAWLRGKPVGKELI